MSRGYRDYSPTSCHQAKCSSNHFCSVWPRLTLYTDPALLWSYWRIRGKPRHDPVPGLPDRPARRHRWLDVRTKIRQGRNSWTQKSGIIQCGLFTWWRHQMETFSALLVLCTGNSPGTGEFPSQRPVTRSFDVSFDNLGLNKRLSEQSRRWWFETPVRPLWRHCNDNTITFLQILHSIACSWGVLHNQRSVIAGKRPIR